jgi:signal transduction histidine kinase
MNPAAPSGLGAFIRAHLEPILKEWDRFARSLRPLADMNAEALRDHAQQLLLCIADDMERPQSEPERHTKSEGSASAGASDLDTVGLLHATARLKDEFTMVQLVAEFRAIRASVLRLWAASQPGVQDAVDDVTRFNEAIDQALAASVARYATRMDESRTLILGMLAHDLRSPLSGISLGMHYLLRSDKTSASAAKVAARTLRSVDEMSELIGDLLDFTSARLGRGIPTSMQEVDIGQICTKAVDDLEASHPGRMLSLERNGDLVARCDAGRIAQLVVNLLTNALHHGDPLHDIALRAIGSDIEILITVHNQGPPIPEADRSQLFEPLNRAVAERQGLAGSSGLRLGLYIASQIASAHKGSLAFVSNAVDGTTFTACLPKTFAEVPA